MKIVGGRTSIKFDLFFEPNEPITTSREFTNELLAWATRDNRDITILRESDDLEPIIEIDGVQHICRLGSPRGTEARAMGLPMITYPLQFKWVYLCKIGN